MLTSCFIRTEQSWARTHRQTGEQTDRWADRQVIKGTLTPRSSSERKSGPSSSPSCCGDTESTEPLAYRHTDRSLPGTQQHPTGARRLRGPVTELRKETNKSESRAERGTHHHGCQRVETGSAVTSRRPVRFLKTQIKNTKKSFILQYRYCTSVQLRGTCTHLSIYPAPERQRAELCL